MSRAREQMEPGTVRLPTGAIGVQEPERYDEIIDRRAREDATRRGRSLEVQQSRMDRETHRDRTQESPTGRRVYASRERLEPEAPKEPGAPEELRASEEI